MTTTNANILRRSDSDQSALEAILKNRQWGLHEDGTDLSAGTNKGKLIAKDSNGKFHRFLTEEDVDDRISSALTTGGFLAIGGNTYAANINYGTNDNYDVILETNNTARMTVKGSGEFGFGTSSPSEQWHFYKSTVGSDTALQLENPDNTNAASGTRLQIRSGGSSGGDPYLQFDIAGVTSWYLGADNSDSDAFKLGTVAGWATGLVLTATTSGNIGISKVPENFGASFTGVSVGGIGSIMALTAESAGAEFDFMTNAYYDGANWRTIIADEACMIQSQDGEYIFRVSNGAIGAPDSVINWLDALRIKTAGNIGINTSSPDARLDVLDTTGPQLRLTYADGSIYTDIETDANGNLKLLPTGGDLGIGKAAESFGSAYTGISIGGLGGMMSITAESAGGQFDIMTNAYFDGTNWRTIIADEACMILSEDGSYIFKVSNGVIGAPDSIINWSEAVKITNSGIVGIGTSGPDAKLDVLDTTGPQIRATYADGSIYTDFITSSAGYQYIRPSGNLLVARVSSASNGARGFLIENLNSSTGGGIVELGFSTEEVDGSETPVERARITSGLDVSNDNYGYLAFWTRNNNVLTQSMTISAGNDVGIGAYPDVRLHIAKSNDTPIMRFERDDTEILVNDVLMKIEVEQQDASINMAGIVGKIELIAELDYTTSADSAWAFYTNTGTANNMSEVMRLNSDGNVGIGISGPDARLDVKSSTTQLRLTYDTLFTTAFTVDVTGNLTVVPDGGSTFFDGAVGVGVTSTGAKIHARSTSTQLRLDYDASNYMTCTVGATGGLTFANATSYSFNDSGGFFLELASAGITSYASSLTLQSTTTQLFLDYSGAIGTSLGTDSSGFLTISPSGGRVGIGVSPDSRLTVKASSTGDSGSIALIATASSNAVARIRHATSGTDCGEIYLYNNGTINTVITTNGDSYFRGGNVGIGTNGPDRKLDVLDSGAAQLRLTHTDSVYYSDFSTDGSGNLTVTPSGGVSTFTGALQTSTYLVANQYLQMNEMTAPGSYGGTTGRIFFDAADGDLKVTFGNGTTKTLATN